MLLEISLQNSVGLEWEIFSETTENTSLCPITISRKLQEEQMVTMLLLLMV
jgi:hypothetical protein